MKNRKLTIFLFFFLILSFTFLYANINKKIIKFYKSYYPNIEIKKIKINPSPPKKYKYFKIMFSPKSSSGNIKIDNKYYYVRIKAFLPVFIANSIIKTNQSIKGHITKKTIPFRYFYSKPLLKINKNLVASKIISKNAVITKNNTKIAPAVFRGENVNVLIKSKDITIYSTAKALQDAYIGNIIKISFRKKIIKAKVIQKGTVLIKGNQ